MEQLGCGLPHSIKNNPHSAHTLLRLHYVLIYLWFAVIFILVRHKHLHLRPFFAGFVNNLRVWSLNSLESKNCAFETAPDRRWINLRSRATCKRVLTSSSRQFKKSSLLHRVIKFFKNMLAVHIKGLRHPPECLFKILFSYQCPFKMKTLAM
jgi:hypothetical protein